MYIVLEGVVGTGKSTQSKRLQVFLQEKYPDKEVIRTREPGGTEIAETIRNVVQGKRFEEDMHPITDTYLYASARAQLLHAKIKPALEKGSIVISDRNFCSSLSYQGYAQGLGMDFVWEVNKQAVQDIMPDIILFMDMDIKTGLARTFDPDGDKRERMDISFFEKAYKGYEELFTFSPTKNIIKRIDAGGTIEEVEQRIQNTIIYK